MRHNVQLLSTTLNLTIREIKVRYAESVFGSVWIVIYPLAFAMISVLVFSVIFQNSIGSTPYFLFVYIGFTSWFWFSQTLIHATRGLVCNRELIQNNKFPTESIVLSIIVARIIDYMINLIVVFSLTIFFNQQISITSVLFVVLISFLQLLFQTGLALLSSLLNVYFRDWQNILDILLQLMFYATPIVYALNTLPKQLQQIIQINPIAKFIIAYRDALLFHHISLLTICQLAVMSIIMFISGYYVYKKSELKFAELI